MPKTLRQQKDIAPFPNPVCCEGMPESVGTTPDTDYSALGAELLKVALKIADSDLGAVLRSEDYIGFVIDSKPFHIPEKVLAKLKGKGDEAMFSALAFHPQDKVSEIYILFGERQTFADTQPAVKQDKCHDMRSQKVCADCFVPQYGKDVVC